MAPRSANQVQTSHQSQHQELQQQPEHKTAAESHNKTHKSPLKERKNMVKVKEPVELDEAVENSGLIDFNPEEDMEKLSVTDEKQSSGRGLDPAKSPPKSPAKLVGKSSSSKSRSNSEPIIPTVPKTPKTPKTPKHKKGSSKRKKKITFKKTVGVHSIPNLSTFSHEEKESYWFTPDEYGIMEDECDMTSEMMDARKPLYQGFCPRGLEAWTAEGEHRKEGHVQLAIDIVWQAQLEQWKASSDISECWEFIRRRYLQVSKPCHKIAHKTGLNDEQDVQNYLVGVRAVEKNRLRLLGLKSKDVFSVSERSVKRSTSEYTPTRPDGKKKIGRNNSVNSPRNMSNGLPPLKGLLKPSAYPSDDEEDHKKTPKAGRRPTSTVPCEKPSGRGRIVSSGASVGAASTMSDDASAASKNSRKIVFKPKSKSKVPVSPVASLCTDADSSDSTSVSRRMRSHMSVCSEDSTRRRMLRTAAIKDL